MRHGHWRARSAWAQDSGHLQLRGLGLQGERVKRGVQMGVGEEKGDELPGSGLSQALAGAQYSGPSCCTPCPPTRLPGSQ